MKDFDKKPTYLHQKFYTNINYLTNYFPLKSVILAISGGQDSICLIKMIQDFKQHYQPLLKVQYIYIDHQWRKDSKNQIQHINNLIRNTNEEIYIYQISRILASEIQARKLRYQILIQHSLKTNNNIIMTGHTQTDKVETFWQQVVRGTSIDGANSLAKRRILNNGIILYRPLINFTRTEIHWFCRQFCLPIWSDITNYSYYIYRNRVRNELIPYLQNYFQPHIEKQISSLLDITGIENEYIKQNALKLYLLSRHKKSIAINYSILKKQHIALQTKTLQIFFYHNLNQHISKNILFKLIHVIQNIGVTCSIIHLQKIKVKICNSWLYIY